MSEMQTVPLKEAAGLLGMSPDALMKKIQRGGAEIAFAQDGAEHTFHAHQLANKRWVVDIPTALLTPPAAEEPAAALPPPLEGEAPAEPPADLLAYLQTENQELRGRVSYLETQLQWYRDQQQEYFELIARLHRQAMEWKPELEVRQLPPPEPMKVGFFQRLFGRKK